MLLAIDIGNSNITAGLYAGGTLGPRWRLATDLNRMHDEYGIALINLFQHAGISPQQVDAIAVASVVPPLTATLEQACVEYLSCAPLVVGVGTKTGIRVRYDDPKQVGADRIADAVAVRRLYGGPACIVDFGTATTFDALSSEGDYLGGAIAPGIAVAADALFQHAAKLPKVELQRPPSVIGKNTVHSVQSGLLFGYVSLVEGMVARFRSELGDNMKVVSTGRLAEVFAKETRVIQIIAPWLTLDGLKIIYEMNR